ncbi:MAG: ATP-binding protein [Desulfobulbaceae bacterium]|nr:ATP-binding protein [Desulfobulbaceae bacterium]
MLTDLFLLTNLVLLAASFFALRLPELHRKFSLAILQALLFLPLLVVEYLAVALNLIPDPEGFTILLASQNLFLVIWSTAARRLRDAMSVSKPEPTAILGLLHAAIVVLILAATAFQFLVPGFAISPEGISFSQFGPVYFASLICLLVMLFMAWQLEAFWRQLPKSRRREYGLFVVGSALVCAVQSGVASFRITYLELTNDILFLQAAFLLIAWTLLAFAVLRHRLLNRNLFISRKIVYSFVAPSLFAAYFLTLGTISLVMRLSGYPLKWVMFWFLVGTGAVAVVILAVSEPVRQRLKFFISTHFYVNKYEYRDEWLAFSALLQDAHSEARVLDALRQVLIDSLYTREIWIWTGSEAEGFGIKESTAGTDRPTCLLTADDPIIRHLRKQPRLDLAGPIHGESDTFNACLASLPSPRPVLFVPLAAGGQLVGCIGLGQEYTGGRYGQDDFDLLAALGSQAASALLAVRLTEETARLRERRALHHLSVFLLHDIKNAASILSLVHANAQEHMDNPEFRKDMLIAIGDALRRMDKVRTNLGMLRDRVESVWQDVALRLFLDELRVRFARRLPGLDIVFDCPQGITLRTDPQLLGTVLENLLLNAFEAGNGSSQVQIAALPANDGLTISVADNGPAIPDHLLPDQLFAPFVSDKPGGSGIGLWQARLVLQRLGGTITADNPASGGARFVIRLPLADSSPTSVGPAVGV